MNRIETRVRIDTAYHFTDRRNDCDWIVPGLDAERHEPKTDLLDAALRKFHAFVDAPDLPVIHENFCIGGNGDAALSDVLDHTDDLQRRIERLQPRIEVLAGAPDDRLANRVSVTKKPFRHGPIDDDVDR